MRSSSRLFPAQLISAESLSGDIAEDVYLIKPRNSSDVSVQIAVTHLTTASGGSADSSLVNARRPVILLHGCYQNRRLWFSADYLAWVEALISGGFDVWLMEHRGHGLSPRNRAYDRNTLEDYARFDLPAVNAFVGEKTGKKPAWVGYGEGAGALLMGLAGGSLGGEVAAVTGMGSPFGQTAWSRLPLPLWASRTAYQSAEQQHIGPESEPWSLRRQLLRDAAWPRRRGQTCLSVDLWERLAESPVPLSWYGDSGSLDQLDPGLMILHRRGALQLLECAIETQTLAAEHIHSTLSDQTKIGSLLSVFNAAMDRVTHDFLPPRETASA